MFMVRVRVWSLEFGLLMLDALHHTVTILIV
jgi:hypothetical protein